MAQDQNITSKKVTRSLQAVDTIKTAISQNTLN